MTLTQQLPTNLHDQKQLSRNITSFKHPLPATRSAGFGVSPAAVAASAWRRSHTHTSGCDTSEGTSELVPWGGTSMRHWNCSSAERARGRATYGTWREPSRLCRGCCRPARRKALPRSRLPEPPASFASWLAVLQRLAAERCRQSLRGVLEGRWAVLRHDRKPSPSYFLFSPLTRSGLQSGGAGSCRAVAAFVFPPRGSCLLLLRSNARGKNSNREGKGGGSRGGDTYPALSLSGKKKEKKSPGDEADNQKSGGRRRSREHAGDGGAEVATAGERSPGRWAAWLGGVSSRLPAHMERLCLRGAEHAAGPAEGRAHARPQRGAARGSISQAVQREQRRLRPEGWKRRRQQRLRSRAADEAGGKPSLLSPLSRPLPGSSFAAACFSLPYPSGCHKPSALPSPRWETGERRNPGARVPQLGRGPRREARASPRAGGGAEVGNSQCDLGTRLQPWLPPTQLQETEPRRSDAFFSCLSSPSDRDGTGPGSSGPPGTRIRRPTGRSSEWS